MIITIDGPSGTGKTTVAREVAKQLNFVYFDTGAMYRALTWFVLEHNVDSNDAIAMKQLLGKFSFNIQEVDGQKRYFVGAQDVTEVIRFQPVTAHVSAVSALKMVRDALLHIQHDFARNRNVVFEGRDLGSVVFPQAEFKFFLTADPEVRAERRYHELLEKQAHKNFALDKKDVLEDLKRRDTLDSTREVAPLKCPSDARCVDTSTLSIDEVVEVVVSYVRSSKGIAKLHSKPNPSSKKNKGNWFYRFILFLANCFFKLCYRHKVYGVHHFCSGGAIIASNHVSYLDPPALAISSPEELHFLAKEELFKNSLFGALIRALNSHPVTGSPGDIAVIRMICKLLKEGKKVLLFPEGKRGAKDELDILKPGIALLIARSKTAVIPAYVYGTFDLWSCKRRFPKLFGKTACVFGTPIPWSHFEHLDKKQAQEAFTSQLTTSLNQLRDWYHNGAKGSPP